MLRPAEPADIDAIAVIWHDAWHAGHVGHVPDGLLAHRDRAQFRARVPGRLSDTMVAVTAGAVVGFVTVLDDEVEGLFVAAPWRGTPIAAMLLAAAEERVAADHETAWLIVATGNGRARRLYEREGWIDGGAIDDEATTSEGRFAVSSRRYIKRVGRSPHR
ncbi:MAG: GNAT family N-acetyltransferase [Desertimonas sp.]